jgi:hypothetical protein
MSKDPSIPIEKNLFPNFGEIMSSKKVYSSESDSSYICFVTSSIYKVCLVGSAIAAVMCPFRE